MNAQACPRTPEGKHCLHPAGHTGDAFRPKQYPQHCCVCPFVQYDNLTNALIRAVQEAQP